MVELSLEPVLHLQSASPVLRKLAIRLNDWGGWKSDLCAIDGLGLYGDRIMGTQNAWKPFKELAEKLVKVPKHEVQVEKRKERAAKKRRKKKS